MKISRILDAAGRVRRKLIADSPARAAHCDETDQVTLRAHDQAGRVFEVQLTPTEYCSALGAVRALVIGERITPAEFTHWARLSRKLLGVTSADA